MLRLILALIVITGWFPIRAQAGAVRGELTPKALSKLPTRQPSDAGLWRLPPGDRSASAASAVVVLESADATNLPDEDPNPITMTFEGYGLTPEIAVVRVGGTLVFRNRDEQPYSCRVEGGSDAFRLDGLKPKETREHKFLATGQLKVVCDGLPYIRSYIIVTTSPLTASTEPDGRFAMRSVPAGTYQARVFSAGTWHWNTRVQITNAGVTRLELGPAGASGSPGEPQPETAAKEPSDEAPEPATPADQEPGTGTKPARPDKPAHPDRRPAADRSPSADQNPPADKPAPSGKKPVADKKPPTDKKPGSDKKPATTKPGQKKPSQKEPEPAFKDVEPEIEIEIEE